MSVAYLPSPSRGVWQLGPLPVRGYALCAIVGVVVALWLTDRRYRAMGGPRGLVLDVATIAVPTGIVGARAYNVLTHYHQYFGTGTDWVSVFRIWDGGLGTAGIVAAGAIGAWVYCRRCRYSLTPLALAAAPALAVAQAIGVWGNWFTQQMYGAPSTLPWAVAIGPERRANDYESFATFQPVFLYESAWDLLVAGAVAYAIRRFLLTGDRAFALYAGLYAAGRFAADLARIDYSPRLLSTRVTELAMLILVIGAAAYLIFTRNRGHRRPAAHPTLAIAPGAGAVGRGSAAPRLAAPGVAGLGLAGPVGGAVGAGAGAGVIGVADAPGVNPADPVVARSGATDTAVGGTGGGGTGAESAIGGSAVGGTAIGGTAIGGTAVSRSAAGPEPQPQA
jgi:prolipoprotein diacylglyceryl transferase